MTNNTIKPCWFVAGTYEYAGSSIMESLLMEQAKLKYLYHVVYDLAQIVSYLQKAQEEHWLANKRLKKVDIHYSEGREGLVWVYLGNQHLVLQKVIPNNPNDVI